jgi:hypothetical protein
MLRVLEVGQRFRAGLMVEIVPRSPTERVSKTSFVQQLYLF